MSALRPLSMMLGLVLLAPLAVAQDNDTDTQQDVLESVAPLNLWVQSAPLSMVIEQVAQLSGRAADLRGTLDMPVSARLTGSWTDVLSKLSASYPVLFDTDDGLLRASHRDEASSISVAVVSDDLGLEFRKSLFDQLSPGNDIEIRADAIRVSGHPGFVRRTTALITAQIARSGARQLAEGAEPTGEIVSATVTSAEPESVIDEASSDGGADPLENSIDNATAAIGSDVVDAGSEEMLADIADEGRPESDQAVLSKPIRWVTDIPGYHTF